MADEKMDEIRGELQGLLSNQIAQGLKQGDGGKIITENNAGSILKLTQAVSTLDAQHKQQRGNRH